MNQSELNQVAMHFIDTQTCEAAMKIRDTLVNDLEERSKQVSGRVVHHIHNMAIFECLVWLNSPITLREGPKEKINEYYHYADELREKFMDIVDHLKDFKVTS
jgi:hypothetical protein